jgi:hypothetical protein
MKKLLSKSICSRIIETKKEFEIVNKLQYEQPHIRGKGSKKYITKNFETDKDFINSIYLYINHLIDDFYNKDYFEQNNIGNYLFTIKIFYKLGNFTKNKNLSCNTPEEFKKEIDNLNNNILCDINSFSKDYQLSYELVKSHFLFSFVHIIPPQGIPIFYTKMQTEKINLKLPQKIIAWDIETITQTWNNNLLKDISVSWCSLLEDEVYYFDWENKKDYYLSKCFFNYVANSAYENNVSSLDMFIEYIINESKNYRVKLLGYNSSGFDLFFLLDRIKAIKAINMNYGISRPPSIFSVKNRIYNIKFGNIESVDLYLHLRMSLKIACDSFKTKPQKIETNIVEQIQSTINDKTFWSVKIQQQFEKELKKYNSYDVLCLFSLLSNYWKLYEKLSFTMNIKPHDYLTSSSLINSIFKKLYKKYNIIKPKTREDFNWFKYTQRAGIVNIFGYENYSKKVNNIRIYDMNSQYPYVCLQYEFPCGDYQYKNYNNGEEPDLVNKLGIYYCKTDQKDLHIPISPTRIPIGKNIEKNNWNTQKEINEVPLNTYEIKYLRNVEGRKVNIIEGITFEGKCRFFKDTMEELMMLKIEQDKLLWKKKRGLPSDGYDDVLRNFYKFLLNGQTGTVNQRLYDTEITFDDNLNPHYINKKKQYTNSELEKLYKKLNNVSRPYLGNFIYSLARLELLDVAGKLGKEVIYGDTDSIIITDKGYDMWVNDNILNKKILDTNNYDQIGKFGLMKFEGYYRVGYFINKKVYCCYDRLDYTPRIKCNPICVCNGIMCENCVFKLKGVIKETSYLPINPNYKNISYNIKGYINKWIKNKLTKEIEKLSVSEHNYLIYNGLYDLKIKELTTLFETKIKNKIYNRKFISRTIKDIQLYKLLYKGHCIQTYRNRLKRNIKKDYKIFSVDEIYIVQPNNKPQETLLGVIEKLILSLYRITKLT